MAETQGPMKMCIVIVPAQDGDRLLAAMAEQGMRATRIGSTGGFLKRGSATVLTAVEESKVDDLAALLHEEFPEVVERMPLTSLPFADEMEGGPTAMVDVRVGGAVLFVLGLDRVERV
ncbi:MAG: cyclic-di-AMP receptor [Dehalococcoidia bacterium]|jgi:uncharacterized protein YaaQ|nr:cyclic-di-AMP receptor [Dehalococcoidia bacterium]